MQRIDNLAKELEGLINDRRKDQIQVLPAATAPFPRTGLCAMHGGVRHSSPCTRRRCSQVYEIANEMRERNQVEISNDDVRAALDLLVR